MHINTSRLGRRLMGERRGRESVAKGWRGSRNAMKVNPEVV